MARDLFRVTFERFSQFDWPIYRTQFLEGLPRHLLHTAINVNPGLRAYHRLHTRCENIGLISRDQWNNPEIYPHLFTLLTSEGTSTERSIRCLELHMGA